MTIDEGYLLVGSGQNVTCPKCEYAFGLSEGLAKQALENIEEKSAKALAEREAAIKEDVEKRANALALQRTNAAQEEVGDLKKLLEEQSKQNKEIVEAARASERATAAFREDELRKEVEARTRENHALRAREETLAARERDMESRVAQAATEKAAELVAADRDSFERLLAERGAQVQALQAEQVSLREERQRLQDQKAALALDVQRQVDAKLQEREGVVRNQEAERARFREAELIQTIEGMKGTISDLQRKAEQGSQQIQGEVLELALEEVLKREFVTDSFEEIKKGARGADVLQRVMTRSLQPAGSILWEAKRAKEWGRDWPNKLKADMQDSGADVGILVTTSMPKETVAGQPFCLHEDVWVSTWGAAVPLAAAIRERVLEVHKQRIVSAGKGEKMEAVYDYVTSPQFAQKLRAVFDTFKRMREELETEKNTTTQRWARREKQIAVAQNSLLAIGGDVQGLAQTAMPQLEMDSDNAVGEGP
jgi:hypothetical protein